MVLGWLLVGCTDADGGTGVGPVEAEARPVTEAAPHPAWDLVQDWPDTRFPAVADRAQYSGVAAGDLDGDGAIDLLYAGAGGAHLLRGDGRGGLALGPAQVFEPPLDAPPRAVALADLDDDGDLDAWLAGAVSGSDVIAYAEGKGRWSVVVLPDTSGVTWTGSLGDLDGDGRVDLYRATYNVPFDYALLTTGEWVGWGHGVWRQDGDRRWSRVPNALPAEVDAAVSLQGTLLDADLDGDLDVYMVNDFGPYIVPNQLLLNDGRGRFQVARDCGCDVALYGMGGGVGDADDDGTPDLFISNVGAPVLLLGDGEGGFVDGTLASGAHITPDERHMTSWGALFADVEQDGDDDMVIAYGGLGDEGTEAIGELTGTEQGWWEEKDQYSVALVNDGDGHFAAASSEAFPELGRSRAVITADLDADGVPELVTVGKGYLHVWEEQVTTNHGLTVRLAGPVGNPHGLGARVEVEVDGRGWTRWLLPSTTASQSALEVYAGLGAADHADVVRVTWPDGRVTVAEDVPAGVWVGE